MSVEERRPFGGSRRVKGQETPTRIQPGSPRPEHALRVCAAGPGRRRCLESGLGEDLGGTAALGGGLAETFQQLLPRTLFFFLSFSQEAATAAAGREEEKEASPAGASAAPGLPGRSAPAPMSPRRGSPTVPRREWGTQSSADSEWPRVSRLSCARPASPPAAALGAVC